MTFASTLADFNTALNVAMLLGLLLSALYFAPRAFKAAEAKAREEEMQRTIAAYKERVETLAPVVTELRAEVTQCQAQTKLWEGRYQEQSKYTAEAALTAVLQELQETRKVFQTSMEALGTLMTEHSRLVAEALGRLDR